MYSRDERINEWLQEHQDVTEKLEKLAAQRMGSDAGKTKEECMLALRVLAMQFVFKKTQTNIKTKTRKRQIYF